ncbi:putative integral membrane protein linked to a cation pump [Thalassovita gelatinovora]|uniref:Putative integral membrane protein linked to a cation pump n=1 Tax=Thalassovita gelatinovora TaxID=53501 RepID=A0A0P1FJJ1_THAGE|nr:FixH family protein [Thalassovita gelatinovora]QIZ81661.1 FixH family protein [Thalassovita gelatinovora]CUH68165.1 putative integral membrane protein linked to a cation pump [Thalassovita gelatinovora]SEQ30425.1 Nitrogen fixation protein FixH [Thalassovita gelatinovora]
MVKEITGKHVLIGFVAAFGIIISVNVVLAVQAVRTFPGLEVKNSYVASQEFNKRKAAQEALGWTIWAGEADGQITLKITNEDGRPVRAAKLDATVGRPTEISEDVTPDFSYDGEAYVAPLQLSGGKWNVRMKAISDNGTEFTQRVVLHVKR